MSPLPDITPYEESPDGGQFLVMTPLGTVAWEPATGDVWDATYDADEATFAALVETFEED